MYLYLVLAFSVGHTSAQTVAIESNPTLTDNLDGQTPVLQTLAASSGFTVRQRAIDRKLFQHGLGAEKIVLRGPAGRSAEVVYQLPGAPVIPELAITADLLTNRPGLQLGARVVLPRSLNRSTGQPFEILVRGSKIALGGNWEQITLKNLPEQLANHARVARAHHGTSLDERGAYVSQLVFLTPGGSGLTELIVDRIQVFGVLGKDLPVAKTGEIPGNRSPHDRLRVPRVIQWQGEPFNLLQQLGFNTIGMNRLPSKEELREIERLNLSVFCPPPAPPELCEQGIPGDLDSVLAWNLGEQVSSDDLDRMDRWEQLVARHDPVDSRPTVLQPQLSTLDSSRISDVTLVGRAVVGTTLTLREHAAWLTQRQRLARPGTPFWTRIETQPSANQLTQAAALSSEGTPGLTASYSQLVALTSTAMSIRSRGFYFESRHSLKPIDQQQRERSLALELTNLRLTLAEPWMVTGKEHSAARSSLPDLSALVLTAERSHLLVPIWWAQDMQSSVHPRTNGPVFFVVPGVAESSEAYLVTLGGMQRLRHQRVTGGIRVSSDALPYDGFLLLSDDPQAIAQITRYVRRIAPRATKLRRELASARLQEAAGMVARTGTNVTENRQVQALLIQAQGELAACDQYIKSGSFELAYIQADVVESVADELEKMLMKKAPGKHLLVAGESHGLISLSDRMHLHRTIVRAPLNSNLLPGGGFENLATMLDSGWRHKQLTLDGITTAVRLSPEAPHSGSYCLELEARAIDETTPVAIVPTSPVWITSAPVQAQKGDLIEITGVTRVPGPLLGSVDGLQIIDSIGGAEMALRINESPTWEPFQVIRAATSDEQVSVTIALSGLGKAQLDDFAVRIVSRR